MSEAGASRVAPGRYPDPERPSAWRYWTALGMAFASFGMAFVAGILVGLLASALGF
jgi:hypothetical protein